MRRLSARFIPLILMLGGLWFFYDPSPSAGWPNDTNAHFGSNGACANGHMLTGELMGVPPNQTFALCVGQSGATTWYGEIRNYNGSVIVCSSGSFTSVGSSGQMTFQCNISQTGYYKGYVYWQVTGSSQTMNHIDYYFRR